MRLISQSRAKVSMIKRPNLFIALLDGRFSVDIWLSWDVTKNFFPSWKQKKFERENKMHFKIDSLRDWSKGRRD